MMKLAVCNIIPQGLKCLQRTAKLRSILDQSKLKLIGHNWPNFFSEFQT